MIRKAFTAARERGFGFLVSGSRCLSSAMISDLLDYSLRQTQRFMRLLCDAGWAKKLSKQRGFILLVPF